MPQRTADGIADDVHAVRNGRIDRVDKVRRIAAGTRAARAQPTGFVGGHPRSRRDPFDVAEQRTEDRCTSADAGGCRGRMCSVAIGIPRRANFTDIDGAGLDRPVDEPARADQLVIAVGFLELLAGLAGTIPEFGLLEDRHVGELAKASTQPASQQRRFAPAAATGPGSIRLAGILKRRMFGRHAAVDDADDYTIAVKTFGAPQTNFCIEEFEKGRAVAQCHRTNLVFPDIEYLGEIFEFVRLGRAHARRKAIESVLIAVYFLNARAGLTQHLVLFVRELTSVRVELRAGLVKTATLLVDKRCACSGSGQFRVILRCRGLLQLHDVDTRFRGVFGAGKPDRRCVNYL